MDAAAALGDLVDVQLHDLAVRFQLGEQGTDGLVADAVAQKKPIVAICIAPAVLAKALKNAGYATFFAGKSEEIFVSRWC